MEYEQNVEDRAKYGANLLEEIAKILKSKRIKGLDSRALRNCRTFYLFYPQIWGSVTAELKEDLKLDTDLLLSRLSFTHFIELIRINDPLERLFYKVEAIKNNWSVRELERAIDSALFIRTGLSKDKQAVIAKIKNIKPENNVDVIRNPYILEFLNLEEKSEYNESELKEAILTHLQKFLVELGTGFCFEARHKRITFDNAHYRIDLVFYHRILKSHVLNQRHK